MNIISKMVCEQAKQNDWGGEEVSLRAVYSDSPENKSFSEATPNAQLKMTITNKAAQNQFIVGKEYFLKFSAADENQQH